MCLTFGWVRLISKSKRNCQGKNANSKRNFRIYFFALSSSARENTKFIVSPSFSIWTMASLASVSTLERFGSKATKYFSIESLENVYECVQAHMCYCSFYVIRLPFRREKIRNIVVRPTGKVLKLFSLQSTDTRRINCACSTKQNIYFYLKRMGKVLDKML